MRGGVAVPLQQAQLDGWWRVTGPGTLAAAAGTVLIVAGVAALRRKTPPASKADD